MKNIVIFDTAVGSSNLGDEIILDSVYRNMGEVFHQGTALRLGTHVTNFTLLQMMRNNDKVVFCKNAELKFICGTNLLSQKMLGKVNSQWQLTPTSIPLYRDSILIGVGATDGGTKMDSYARWLYKNVLSHKYIHSVRDEQTKQMVNSLGLKAINTGCPTLWNITPELCQTIPTNKAEKCIFTVSGYPKQQDIENDKKMLSILNKNYSKLWCWIQTKSDIDYLRRLPSVDKIECIYSLEHYKHVLESEDVDYVGTRLHGGVFALQHGKRSIVISIDNRAEGLHNAQKLPIVHRKDISNRLEEMICSGFKTEIITRQKEVRAFKKQFL